jgi:hypothetical protein
VLVEVKQNDTVELGAVVNGGLCLRRLVNNVR